MGYCLLENTAIWIMKYGSVRGAVSHFKFGREMAAESLFHRHGQKHSNLMKNEPIADEINKARGRVLASSARNRKRGVHTVARCTNLGVV